MSISSLPDEILEQVFLERVISDDESKLGSLALVNRSFSRCIRLALYESITIWLSGERYVQLMRTLNDHPQLGSLVHCVFIDLDPYSGYSQPDKREEQMEVEVARKLASNFLSLLPALRTLEIAAWFPLPAGSWSILDIPMRFLRTAKLGGIKFTAAEAARLILLPNITTLSISFGRHSITERFLPPALTSKPGISSLKSLQFDECIEFSSSLQELLALPRALESFSCHFGWAPEAVSLVTLARGLAPMYPSVTDLNLTGRFQTDGKLLDFRRFECLKYLKVSNTFCFSVDAHDRLRKRQGLYKRLPASLESLQVSLNKPFS
ncbi:hypothetical protein MMC30_001977 [Trapelia coarctata]|nr:hypothetical protein [Trapelia coarctata]